MSVKNLTFQEQTGGWKSIQIATLEEIQNCPEILTNANAHKIEVFGTADTIDITPIPETFVVNAPPKKTAAGLLFRIKIFFEFPYQSHLIDDYFFKHINKKCIVFGETSFGAVKVFGSKRHPLHFIYEQVNGKKLDDKPLTRVTISATISQKPVFIVD